MDPELSRKVAVDRLPREGMEVVVEANPAECIALAGRMHLPAVHALWCRFLLTPQEGGAVQAEGWLRARAIRECVVSLEPFEEETEEKFRLRFVPAGTESEVEDPESDDELGYQEGVIDLGEAAAEQFALALDPWPRKPGAELPAAAGDEGGPFAALARLKAPH
jgi:hypothetical protein